MKIAFLIDKSGSMQPQVDDVVGSFNTFVKEQSPDTELSLWTFSNDLKCVFKEQVSNVKPITSDDYKPSGGTALYDAMGEVLKGLASGDRLIVLTDGQENSSKRYTKQHVKDLISLSGVTVVYAGADLEDAKELGVHHMIAYDGSGTCDTMTQIIHSV